VGRRFLATVIDLVVVNVVGGLLWLVSPLVGIPAALVAGIVLWLALPARKGEHNGQGLGGQLTRIRAVSAERNATEVRFDQAFLRGIGYVLLGVVWAVFDGIVTLVDAHNQSYSDGMARTYSFRDGADARLAPALIVKGRGLPDHVALA
jgi:uncharacterized RDD family membrane protein YckC